MIKQNSFKYFLKMSFSKLSLLRVVVKQYTWYVDSTKHRQDIFSAVAILPIVKKESGVVQNICLPCHPDAWLSDEAATVIWIQKLNHRRIVDSCAILNGTHLTLRQVNNVFILVWRCCEWGRIAVQNYPCRSCCNPAVLLFQWLWYRFSVGTK